GDIRRALALVRRRTHRGPPLGARLLEKSDCGLCAEAYRALRRVALDVPLEIERVDITKDPALFDRYALRIPVVVVGERELDVAGQELGLRRLARDEGDRERHRAGSSRAQAPSDLGKGRGLLGAARGASR